MLIIFINILHVDSFKKSLIVSSKAIILLVISFKLSFDITIY